MPLKYPNYLFNPRNNRSLIINNVQIIIGAGPGDKYIPPENPVKKDCSLSILNRRSRRNEMYIKLQETVMKKSDARENAEGSLRQSVINFS